MLKLQFRSSLLNYLSRGWLKNPLNKCHCSTYVSDNVTVPFATKYDARTVENNKYLKWEIADLFQAERHCNSDGKVFSMILPPPNITGTLHLGHALTVTLQDILCRWKRMQGFTVLWVPGADHAGIATQVMVEKYLFGKTGLTRKDIGKEEFLEQVLLWKAGKINKIIEQLRQLGASVDWSKFSYTMDAKQSVAVVEAVIKLFDEGLLYRENGIVNWSCYLQSTISETEIDYLEISEPTSLPVPGYSNPVKFGVLYNFTLKVIDTEEEIVVSTTRPETVFGDVAVAVHPEDNRYAHLKGASLFHPIRRCRIPLIFDERVDPIWGSGAVKITPAHNKLDFEIGKQQKLPMLSIFTEAGLMNEVCEEYANLPRFLVREKIVEQFKCMGILKEEKCHEMRVPICGRSGDIVEQVLKPQWYLRCDELARRAVVVVEKGDLVIEPSSYIESYVEWLKNTKDWCISRQIWWGHRLPLYKTDFGWVAARSIEEAREKGEEQFHQECTNIQQEEDVLDTWFSSSLLPFSVFRWPQTFPGFVIFYPLSLLETGADILTLWVTRMVMMGLHFTNDLPFKKVFLHGMMCDHQGRKMSKSLGNVIQPNYIISGISLNELNDIARTNAKAGLISPMEMEKAFEFQEQTFPKGINACGADALRLTLTSYNVTDKIIFFNSQDCETNLHFCNKLWQASKFILGWTLKYNVTFDSVLNPIFPWHNWLLHRLSCTVETMNRSFEEMNFKASTDSLKQFLHKDFCDIFLEISKPTLKNGTDVEALATCSVMFHCLETYLRLISPVMPFIADELYSYLPGCSKIIVGCCSYPQIEDFSSWRNDALNEEMDFVRNIVRCVRVLISSIQIKNNEFNVIIVSERKDIVANYLKVIQTLLRCNSVTVGVLASTKMLCPTNIVRKDTTVHLLTKKLTDRHIVTNANLLDVQISRIRQAIRKKMNKCKEVAVANDQLINLMEEWTNIETELENVRQAVENISWDYIAAIVDMNKKLHKFQEQLDNIVLLTNQ